MKIKIVSLFIILFVSLFFCSFTIVVNAEEENIRYECKDGLIDIGYNPNVPEIDDMNTESFIAGDVDCDGELTINDASLIQKYLAGLYDKLPVR